MNYMKYMGSAFKYLNFPDPICYPKFLSRILSDILCIIFLFGYIRSQPVSYITSFDTRNEHLYKQH